MTSLVIDESNFTEYFREINKSKPQKGDVLACYRAIAELVDGDLKEQIVESLFLEKIGPKKAVALMTKLGKTSRKEAIKLVKKIFMDLYNGMSKTMVLSKTYEYLFEIYYYTKEEYVPKNDKHWELIKLNNVNEFIDKFQNNIEYQNESKQSDTITVCEK